MVRRLGRRPGWRTCALAGLAIAAVGCSTIRPPSMSAASKNAEGAGPPLVQNCAIVGISSPSKYACGGKVYTSFQLLKLRQEWEQAPRG